jgi:hypothetical protein
MSLERQSRVYIALFLLSLYMLNTILSQYYLISQRTFLDVFYIYINCLLNCFFFKASFVGSLFYYRPVKL